MAARKRPGGISLGLTERLHTTIWWQGKRGLILSKLRNQIDIMCRYEDAPEFLIIHVAGNDIGYVRLGYLQYLIKKDFDWLFKKFPNTLIIWSQILPRRKWRYSSNLDKMENTRLRINSTVAKYFLSKGGGYIHYPEIKANNTFLDEKDGVHLTSLGNEVFLNTIQGAIETFLTSDTRCYPQ